MSFRADQEAAEAAHVPHWHLVGPVVLDSLHGTHQLYRFIGRWSGGGDVGEWAALTDKASGEALLDMSAVRSGSAVWRADGCLLVRLEGQGDARLLIIDPDMRSFRRIGNDKAARPIAELQAMVAQAARQVGADDRPPESDDPWLQREFGPDGHVMVEYLIQTQRMSHETRTPRITDVATGDALMDLDDSLFDGSVTWVEDGKLSVFLRHYVLGGGMAVHIDPARRTWCVPGAGTGEMPLATINADLPRRYRALSDARQKPASAAPPGGRWAGMGVIGALILVVAAIMAVVWFTAQPAKQKLTPMPTFPSSR